MDRLIVLLVWLVCATALASTAQAADEAAADTAATPAADVSGESAADAAIDEEFVDEFADEEEGGNGLDVWDPLQPFNRGMFWFNDKLYFYAIKPLARVARALPEDVRVCVSNFFTNLAAPMQIANALLQGKINAAGNELSRFILNTTIGVGGLFDPAKRYAKLRPTDEDFGQTLGVWGVEPGFYLVIPVIGPSSARDAVGQLSGLIFDPVGEVWQGNEYWIAKSVDVVNAVSLDKDTYEAIKRDSLDPYLFLRDAYMQNRAGRVAK